MRTSAVLRAFRFLVVVFLLAGGSLPVPAQQQQPSPQQQQAPAQKQPKRTFWQWFLRFTGISATPSSQKAPGDEALPGDIWLVQVESSQALRLTEDGGYRSPIFLAGDQKILALKSTDVMEISVTGGQPRKLFCVAPLVKLVGVNMDDPTSILVLIVDQNRKPVLALLSLNNGSVTAIPSEAPDEYRRALNHAKSWERVYGNSRVYVKTEVKNDLAGPLEWTDVYLKQADSEPRNISRCDGINCGQPSLSRNGRAITYVKAKE